MKLLAKLGSLTLLAGIGATALYASPNTLAPAGAAEAQVLHAQALREQMLDDARHVQHLQQIAHREKDVIKLNCVNDKLVQIRPQLNIADRAQADIAAGQGAGVHEVDEAAQSVHHLREAADQCIGEPMLGTESSNSYTHPPILDPTTTNPWGDVFEPPGYASPMQ